MPRRGKNKSKNKRLKGFLRQAKRLKIKIEQMKERRAAEIERNIPKNDGINQPKNEKADTKVKDFKNVESSIREAKNSSEEKERTREAPFPWRNYNY